MEEHPIKNRQNDLHNNLLNWGILNSYVLKLMNLISNNKDLNFNVFQRIRYSYLQHRPCLDSQEL